MSLKFKYSKLIYRELKVSDFGEFKKLFYLSFKRKMSFDFFKWRYFTNKLSFCYGVFSSSRLIANVGMFSIKLSKNNEKIYSRHSSMVLKKYRGNKIYSELLKRVKTKISKKVRIVVMWPNKNNFANFGIANKNLIKKKYYLYRTSSSKSLSNKIKYYKIDELIKFKNFIKNNNNFFHKNYAYFKGRYLTYKNTEYLINQFKFKKLSSFFIIKHSLTKKQSNFIILDHFGSKNIISKHLSYLIKSQNKLIFLSKKKINKSNYELLNFINLKIGFIKKINIKEKKTILKNKEIFLGDTDIFITVN